MCVYVKPVTENETEEVREDVKELQDLGVTFKEQKRLQKKVSISFLLSFALLSGCEWVCACACFHEVISNSHIMPRRI